MLQVSISATSQLAKALTIASGEMIAWTSSVPKPVVMHCTPPDSLIEKAIFTEVKRVLLIANCKTALSWVTLYIMETTFFLSVLLMAAETYLITVIKSLQIYIDYSETCGLI